MSAASPSARMLEGEGAAPCYATGFSKHRNRASYCITEQRRPPVLCAGTNAGFTCCPCTATFLIDLGHRAGQSRNIADGSSAHTNSLVAIELRLCPSTVPAGHCFCSRSRSSCRNGPRNRQLAQKADRDNPPKG